MIFLLAAKLVGKEGYTLHKEMFVGGLYYFCSSEEPLYVPD